MAAKPLKAVQSDQDIDRLAEEVSLGRNISLAATRLGLAPARAEDLWNRIVNQLGWQAHD